MQLCEKCKQMYDAEEEGCGDISISNITKESICMSCIQIELLEHDCLVTTDLINVVDKVLDKIDPYELKNNPVYLFQRLRNELNTITWVERMRLSHVKNNKDKYNNKNNNDNDSNNQATPPAQKQWWHPHKCDHEKCDKEAVFHYETCFKKWYACNDHRIKNTKWVGPE